MIEIKVWYDTEFHERGPDYPVELLSIGMVREDGEELYLINLEADWDAVHENEWLEKNVIPCLDNDEKGLWSTRDEMAKLIYNFLMGPGARKNNKDWPELFAWYSSYDHVVLAQIFGRMIDFPRGVPMYTHDVRSLADWFGVKSWPKQSDGNHNALADAKHLRKIYDHIIETGSLQMIKTSGKN